MQEQPSRIYSDCYKDKVIAFKFQENECAIEIATLLTHTLRQGVRIDQQVKPWASAPMAWVRSQLSARGFLHPSPQLGGFMCLTTWFSSAFKSSRVENTTTTLRTDAESNEPWDMTHKTRVVISAIKAHTCVISYAASTLLLLLLCTVMQRWLFG